MRTRKIWTLYGIILVLVAFGCKGKGFQPDQDKIDSVAINREIKETLATAQAETDDNKKAKLYAKAALLLNEKGDYQKANAAERDALRANPTQSGANGVISNVYLHNGKVDEAMLYAEEAVMRSEGKNAFAYFVRGNARVMKGMYAPAVADYKKAISLKSRILEAYINLASAYGSQHQYASALEVLEDAIKMQPGRAVTYRLAGVAAEKAGKKPQAREFYGKYLELMPQAEDRDIVIFWMTNL